MDLQKERTVIRLRGRNQFTLPDRIASQLSLKEGDFLEVSMAEGGAVRLVPVRLVPVVGTPEADQMVRRGKEDVQAGRVEVFDSPQALEERIVKGKKRSRATHARQEESMSGD